MVVNLRRFECDEGSISHQRRVTLYCRDSNSNVFEFVALEKREFLLPLAQGSSHVTVGQKMRSNC